MDNYYNKDKILIIDFGSQYTQLIARKIRELRVYSELWRWNIVTINKIKKFKPNGIILSGGPASTTDLNSPKVPDYIFNAGCPVLGICYGMQLMAMQLGGNVNKSDIREFGYAQIKIMKNCTLLDNIQDNFGKKGIPLLDVWMSHGDQITTIPPYFKVIAATINCPIAVMANEEKKFYGLQFHPEVTHTKQGQRILKKFLYDICSCEGLWQPVQILENIKENLRRKIKNDYVILGVSGGIDSYVTAVILHKVIGNHLICVFVDNGLLRMNEAEQVKKMFSNYFSINLITIKAEKVFLQALVGICDPENKRKIIGNLFIDIFNKEAIKIPEIKWLAQGTIYPDVIESSSYPSDIKDNQKNNVIKSHHNVGGLPNQLKFGLIEPLKKLFKDEVRQIGLKLNIPYDILYRHPFPGPGLGVRVIGEVKKKYCDLLRHADSIFIEELKHYGLYFKISQAFTVFLPIRSVGIMGDNRKYDWVIALRAVKTIDFMTAEWVHLPYKLLEVVSNRIVNEVPGISRVVYDISGKPPATIEWE
ncbi:MAG: glutamine-hydrolyzing GMP synthase [Candidatus Dasytiphilus stammeri]